jgi:cyclohexanone monooxygenase
MKCEPTALPEEIDIPALKAKYRQERDKRVRKDGQAQYIKLEGEFASYAESDPHMATTPRAPISEDIDVAIIGAGFTGLLAAVRLKEYGVTNFRVIDAAGDFGGA